MVHRAQWVFASVLGLAAVVIAWMGLAGPEAPVCRFDEASHRMPTMASADELRWQGPSEDGTASVRVRVRWLPEQEDGPSSGQHIVVVDDLGALMVHPLGSLPNEELPEDWMVSSVLRVDGRELPIWIRHNPTRASPFATAWVYVIQGEATADPLGDILRRAFAKPWVAAPSVEILAGDHTGSNTSMTVRERTALEHLSGLWRDWEARCPS